MVRREQPPVSGQRWLLLTTFLFYNAQLQVRIQIYVHQTVGSQASTRLSTQALNYIRYLNDQNDRDNRPRSLTCYMTQTSKIAPSRVGKSDSITVRVNCCCGHTVASHEPPSHPIHSA